MSLIRLDSLISDVSPFIFYNLQTLKKVKRAMIKPYIFCLEVFNLQLELHFLFLIV